MSAAHEVALTVNGRAYQRRVEARLSLADFLRDDLGLTGTHVGCEHGVCGACTILMDGHPVRSCLLFAVQAEGADLTTIEGLAGYEPLPQPPPPVRGRGLPAEPAPASSPIPLRGGKGGIGASTPSRKLSAATTPCSAASARRAS